MRTITQAFATSLPGNPCTNIGPTLGKQRGLAHHLVDVEVALGLLARHIRRTSGWRVSMTTVHTVILAKAPLPGFAKTRLIKALGATGAATLAGRLIRHTVAQALSAGIGRVELCVTPDNDHPIWRSLALPAGITRSTQGTGDLGDRMTRISRRVMEAGEALLIIGTDCPQLDSVRLHAAATALDSADACMVPVSDGGYALIGLRQFHASLFRNMPWSTARVANVTRQRMMSLGWITREFPVLHDIDEPEDLFKLPHSWR